MEPHLTNAVVRDTVNQEPTRALSHPGNADCEPLVLGRDSLVEIAPDGPNCEQTKRWAIAALLWIGVIFFSSTALAGRRAEQAYSWIVTMLARHFQTGITPTNTVHFIAEKGFHVFLFVMLAVLLWKAIPSTHRNPIFILCIGSAVGSCSEWLQRFQPGRDPSWRDVYINAAATAFGIVVSLLLFRPKHLSQPG
jgi:VanZ family protein